MAVENNLVCPICGKHFHRKPYTIKIAKWKDGMCCSLACTSELRKIKFKGENNHQYGLRGPKNATFLTEKITKKNHRQRDVLIYVGEWHKKAISGRLKEHRYLAEKNH